MTATLLRRQLLIVGALALGASCSPGANDTPTDSGGDAGGDVAAAASPPIAFANGSRLIARGYASPEDPGVVLLQGWRDTELDIDCRFVPAVDGKVRCLPVADSVYRYYSSDDCSDDEFVVGLFGSECGQRLVTYDEVAQRGCEWRSRVGVLELGEATSVAGLGGARVSSRTCIRPQDLVSAPDHYCGATEAPLDRFVRAERRAYDAGDLQLIALVGEDGSLVLDSAHDPGLGVDLFEFEERVLAPHHFFSPAQLYADAACGAPAICDPQCEYWLVYTSDGPRVRRRGDPLQQVFHIEAEACGPASQTASCFELGEELPERTLEIAHHGAGRLRSIWYRHAGYDMLRNHWTLYDAELETECRPRHDDAEPRCWPARQLFVYSLWTDANCTVPAGHGLRHLPLNPFVDTPLSPAVFTSFERVYRASPRELEAPQLFWTDPEDGRPVPTCERVTEPLAVFDLDRVEPAALVRMQ